MNATITTIKNDHGNEMSQIVADNLAAELARKRISGRDAAMRLGLSQPYVARRVSGATPLDVNDLFMFAGFLGIDPSVLLKGENPHQSPDGDATRRGTVPMIVGSENVTDLSEYRASVAQGIEHWFPVPVVGSSNLSGGTEQLATVTPIRGIA